MPVTTREDPIINIINFICPQRIMKPNKEFRGKSNANAADDVVKKAAKLPPIKKSGKEKHMIFSSLEEEDDFELQSYRKKESVLDYFDDEEEEF